MKRGAFLPFLFLAALCLIATAPLGAQSSAPSPSATIFELKPFGPLPAPTQEPPTLFLPEESVPLPRSWLIAGGAAALLLLLLLLWGATRAWRSSNLFDQQYRFPEIEVAALRFGAQKSGGHLARIELPPRA